MSYFLPSFFQKRILRYALTRLELLDTDGLDLEKLDITWGKKSTIELRDIGMNIEKISALLKLPQAFSITKAQISTMRVTVPADLYHSNIVVEADGVDFAIRADSASQENDLKQRHNPSEKAKTKQSRNSKADGSVDVPPLIRDPIIYGETIEPGEDHDVQLPTSLDLAQSFIQSEPLEERSELQAAVAHSLQLSQSLPSRENDLEASEVGMGNEISLPGFLAAYLKGVGDRVKVSVKNIRVDLVLRLSNKAELHAREDIKIRAATDRIVVGEISRDPAGKEIRRVEVTHIQLVIISEQSLFSNLAKSTNLSSPETAQASAILKTKNKLREPQSDLGEAPSSTGIGSDHYYHEADHKASQPFVFSTQTSATMPPSRLHKIGAELPAEQSVEEDRLPEGSFLSDSFHSIEEHGDFYNRMAKQPGSPQLSFFAESDDEMTRRRIASMSRTLQGTNRHSGSPPGNSNANSSSNFPNLCSPENPTRPPFLTGSRETSEMFREETDRPSPQCSDSTTARSSPASEDLAESRIFSHDQRNSMYISVLSGVPSNLEDGENYIPGAWESSSPEEDRSAAVQIDKSVPQAASGSHDKVEKPKTDESIDDTHTQGYHVEKLEDPAKSLRIEELAEQRLASPIEPKSGFESPVSDAIDASPRLSESLHGSPRDSTILAKQILSVDSITLDFPCGITETISHLEDPADHQVPFEVLPTTRSERGHKASLGLSHDFEKGHPKLNRMRGTLSQLATVISIGHVQIVGDVGLTKLTALVAKELNTICQPSIPRTPRSAPSRSQMPFACVMIVDEISWKFVELVKAISVPDRTTPQMNSLHTAIYGGADILLSSNMTSLQLNQVQWEENSRTNISVGKFVVGYADANILSFDAGTKMREPSRNVSTPSENDIGLEIVGTKGSISVDITTLPMHVVLDLRRLDETFSWFGGFSSMLGLGSSMISTVTLLDPNARASPLRKAPRAVHFDIRARESAQQQGAALRSKKVTARIGGVVFDLQGTGSGLRVESTAMKIVSRPEGLGTQIDRLKLNGPVLGQSYDDPPILAKLANIRIEYLTTPKENDLTRLLRLLGPSKDQHGDDDDILLDTLLRQRKKGSVLRVTVETLDFHLFDTPVLHCFPALMEEAKKLSTVAKYLPEDDRPGVLALLLIKSISAEGHVNENFGIVSLKATNLEIANITFPSLIASSIDDLHVYRNTNEELFGEALKTETGPSYLESHPMIMVRFVGNEMEPTIKIKFYNARFEYHVTTIISFMDLRAELAAGNLMSDVINSVVELNGRQNAGPTPSRRSSELFLKNDDSFTGSRALRFDVVFHEVILGLNPLSSSVKGLMVFTDAHFTGAMPDEKLVHSTLEIRKAELMIIDDVTGVSDPHISNARKNVNTLHSQVQALSETGYVSISQISAMKIILQLTKPGSDSGSMIEAEISDYLFVLESCADSTQTVISLLKNLKPPTPKSTALKYQTEIIPVENMLASFSGEAFAMEKGNMTIQAYEPLDDEEEYSSELDESRNLELDDSFYNPDLEYPLSESLRESTREELDESVLATSMSDNTGVEKPSKSLQEQMQVTPDPPSLDIRDDYFDLDSSVRGATRRWDPRQNLYGLSKEKHRGNPLRVRMRNVHVIWNLFDGYDWQHTRDTITQAVAEVQTKAVERQVAQKRKSFEPEEEDEDVIGDFLFNSIYIGIPAKSDPAELARQINHNIDDLVSETGSFSTSKSSKVSPSRAQSIRPTSKHLRLKRSKHHKMTFELKGVSADLNVFPPNSGETESSLDIRVQDLEIFDHVPTSTWKKFATYMHDAGEKESGTCMLHIELLNVKPVPNLAASEIMLKVSVLPLRLHVDQDALDFLTRFFSFKEDSAPDMAAIQADAPFIQRAEFKSIRIRLDFKPKRVNYAGLRSGRTTEFMNFLILDSADMVLRHAIVYGVSGFDRLGNTLNDVWMPDIKQNQLPGVLAGLAPVRSLVNVGGGMRDLFVVPIREYKKDGRVVRSFQKGALAFAKTTTGELMRLGAKLAIGTQNVLQSAEDILNQSKQSHDRLDITAGWDDSDMEESERKQISLYADQPIGVVQGLRGAYASLERDLLTARDAVVAMPGEIMESGTAGGAAKAVLRRAPTVILRPAMGVSMAVGQTLMGATNSLDPDNRRRVEDKYKKH